MPFLGLVRARMEWGPCSCPVYRGKVGLRTLPWTQDPHTPLRTLRGLAQSAGLRARAPGVPRVFSREDPSTDASVAGGHGHPCHPRPPPATAGQVPQQANPNPGASLGLETWVLQSSLLLEAVGGTRPVPRLG